MSQPQISAFPLGIEQPLPALVFPQWTKALVCRKEGKGGKLQGVACIYLFLNFLLALSLFFIFDFTVDISSVIGLSRSSVKRTIIC